MHVAVQTPRPVRPTELKGRQAESLEEIYGARFHGTYEWNSKSYFFNNILLFLTRKSKHHRQLFSATWTQLLSSQFNPNSFRMEAFHHAEWYFFITQLTFFESPILHTCHPFANINMLNSYFFLHIFIYIFCPTPRPYIFNLLPTHIILFCLPNVHIDNMSDPLTRWVGSLHVGHA